MKTLSKPSSNLYLFLSPTSSIAGLKKKHSAATIHQNVLESFRSPDLNNYISFSLNYNKGTSNGILGKAPNIRTSRFRLVIAKAIQRKGKTCKSMFSFYFWKDVPKIIPSSPSPSDSDLVVTKNNISLDICNRSLRIRKRYIFEKDWHHLEPHIWGCSPKKRIKLMDNHIGLKDYHCRMLMNHGGILMLESERISEQLIAIAGNHGSKQNTASLNSVDHWSNRVDLEEEASSYSLNFIDAYDVGESTSISFESNRVDHEEEASTQSRNFVDTFEVGGTELLDYQTKMFGFDTVLINDASADVMKKEDNDCTKHHRFYNQLLVPIQHTQVIKKRLRKEDLLEPNDEESAKKRNNTGKKSFDVLLSIDFSKGSGRLTEKRNRSWELDLLNSASTGPRMKKTNIRGKEIIIKDPHFYSWSGNQINFQSNKYINYNYDSTFVSSLHNCFKRILVGIFLLNKFFVKDYFCRRAKFDIKNFWIVCDTDQEISINLFCSCQKLSSICYFKFFWIVCDTDQEICVNLFSSCQNHSSNCFQINRPLHQILLLHLFEYWAQANLKYELLYLVSTLWYIRITMNEPTTIFGNPRSCHQLAPFTQTKINARDSRLESSSELISFNFSSYVFILESIRLLELSVAIVACL